MIAPQIFVLSLLLSLVWGWYLRDTVHDWREIRRIETRRRGEMADAFRAMLCAISLESICAAYVLRTALVVIGLGDATAGQVVFFTLLGVNIPAALFVVASRRMR